MKSAILSKTMRARLVLGLVVTAGVLLAALSAASGARAAATFNVNGTGDASDANFSDGKCDTQLSTVGLQCTLRAAIEQADESPGGDVIRFDIPGGSGVKTIIPSAVLPPITEAVTIDGYTQPGAKKNTKKVGTDAVLKVALDGSNIELVGLEINGLDVLASNVVIRGLVIKNFKGDGIETKGANTRIEGNFLGTDSSGTQASSNFEGVRVEALNTTVGGTTLDKRNLISGNFGNGVIVFDSGAKVQGNLIGTARDGTTGLPNQVAGVDLRNLSFSSPANNTVGGTVPEASNTIAFNKRHGVNVASGIGHRILSNSIFSNDQLGINHAGGTQDATGANQNDLKDPDNGPNDLQNKPIVSSATTAPGRITVEGNLNSVPGKTFSLRFFSNLPGENEGRSPIGTRSVTTNANGNAPFTFSMAKTVQAGRTVTATATGAGGTSEFSAQRTVVAQ